jgi:ribonuclease P protein component
MQPGHDYVIVAHRDALNASFEELTKALATRISTRPKRQKPASGKE